MGGAWTYSAGYPVLRVSTGGGGGGSRLTITQVRRQTVPFSSSVSS
jgi:aminopeptidase N